MKKGNLQNIPKTEREWREKLTPEEYAVLREGATEKPFAGVFTDSKDVGMYICKGCGIHLFSSDTEFDSGSGWPSFKDAIPGSVELHEDTSHGMVRTEVRCAQCKSHLGHVFDDGPGESKRYCINSVCLDLEKENNA